MPVTRAILEAGKHAYSEKPLALSIDEGLALRDLARGNPAKYTHVSALLRSPAGQAEAMAAMVEENEVREALSPWDRGRIALAATDMGVFDTLDAALATLFPHASIRTLCELAPGRLAPSPKSSAPLAVA